MAAPACCCCLLTRQADFDSESLAGKSHQFESQFLFFPSFEAISGSQGSSWRCWGRFRRLSTRLPGSIWPSAPGMCHPIVYSCEAWCPCFDLKTTRAGLGLDFLSFEPAQIAVIELQPSLVFSIFASEPIGVFVVITDPPSNVDKVCNSSSL